jgi:hypothetical protein
MFEVLPPMIWSRNKKGVVQSVRRGERSIEITSRTNRIERFLIIITISCSIVVLKLQKFLPVGTTGCDIFVSMFFVTAKHNFQIVPPVFREVKKHCSKWFL